MLGIQTNNPLLHQEVLFASWFDIHSQPSLYKALADPRFETKLDTIAVITLKHLCDYASR